MDAPEIVPAPPAQPPRTSRGFGAQAPSGQLGRRVQSLRLSHIPERRFNPLAIVGWALLALVIGGVGVWGYGKWKAPPVTAEGGSAAPAAAPASEKTAPTKGNPNGTPPVAALKPIAPEAAPGEIALESKGYVVPAHQILVSPQVSGMIVQLDVEEGKRVQKGAVLAVLESTDYEADVQRATATVRLSQEKVRELENGSRPEEISQAAAELAESQAQMNQLQAEWKRSSDLRRSTSITQQEYEVAESNFKAMQQRVQRLTFALDLLKLGARDERKEIAKAELAQAQADLSKAEWRLGNCTIRAPIAGTILRKNAEEGNIVNPIAFNGSYSLCEMADLSDLEVDLNIQERDVSLVNVGQQCRVRAEAWPDRVYAGVVSRLMPIADRAKGAIPVRVKLTIPADEEGVYLKPEMGAIVTFLSDGPSASPLPVGEG